MRKLLLGVLACLAGNAFSQGIPPGPPAGPVRGMEAGGLIPLTGSGALPPSVGGSAGGAPHDRMQGEFSRSGGFLAPPTDIRIEGEGIRLPQGMEPPSLVPAAPETKPE